MHDPWSPEYRSSAHHWLKWYTERGKRYIFLVQRAHLFNNNVFINFVFCPHFCKDFHMVQTFREFSFSSEISTCWTQQSNISPYTCFMFIDQWKLCTLSFLEPRWQFSDCFLCPKKPVLRVKCIPSWTSIIQFNITRIYGEWWLHASVLTIYPSARVSPWESTTFVSTKSHNHLL